MSVTAMPKPVAPPPADKDATGKGKSKGKAKEEGKGGKKKLVMILVVLLALGGGGFMMFRPKPPAPPKPGAVVALDPIQINLAADHYLRIGIALQLTDKSKEADGSKALDATIDEFSGQPIADVSNPKKRRAMKKELEATLQELYDDEVMGVYFTEFVTQ